MTGTTVATLTAMRAFFNECEQFEGNMKKSMTRLESAITAARSGWRDGGFESVQHMVQNVRHGVGTIENTVSSKVVPFVGEQIKWYESKPY